MLKLLIADDEPDILRLMAKRAAAAGYDVVTAEDGQAAWEKIVAEKPDAVLLDLSMPFMNGFEVLKRLRENPPSPKWCPVIIISAHAELADMRKGFELEADHYLVKPCSAEEALKAVECVLSLRAGREEG